MIARKGDRSVPTDQEIYDRIYLAILERRLNPGAHLREHELATMFGVGRTKVRQALAKLVEVGVVVVERNRGASVAAPTRQEAGQVFDLRDMLEPAIAARLATRHTPDNIKQLRTHLAREDKARIAHDEAALIRLTGDFHLLLAAQLANPLIDRMLKGLEALTCLAILSYSRRVICACLPHEHTEIVDTLEACDGAAANRSMAIHLHHVREELDLDERVMPVQDLVTALGVNNR